MRLFRVIVASGCLILATVASVRAEWTTPEAWLPPGAYNYCGYKVSPALRGLIFAQNSPDVKDLISLGRKNYGAQILSKTASGLSVTPYLSKVAVAGVFLNSATQIGVGRYATGPGVVSEVILIHATDPSDVAAFEILLQKVVPGISFGPEEGGFRLGTVPGGHSLYLKVFPEENVILLCDQLELAKSVGTQAAPLSETFSMKQAFSVWPAHDISIITQVDLFKAASPNKNFVASLEKMAPGLKTFYYGFNLDKPTRVATDLFFYGFADTTASAFWQKKLRPMAWKTLGVTGVETQCILSFSVPLEGWRDGTSGWDPAFEAKANLWLDHVSGSLGIVEAEAAWIYDAPADPAKEGMWCLAMPVTALNGGAKPGQAAKFPPEISDGSLRLKVEGNFLLLTRDDAAMQHFVENVRAAKMPDFLKPDVLPTISAAAENVVARWGHDTAGIGARFEARATAAWPQFAPRLEQLKLPVPKVAPKTDYFKLYGINRGQIALRDQGIVATQKFVLPSFPKTVYSGPTFVGWLVYAPDWTRLRESLFSVLGKTETSPLRFAIEEVGGSDALHNAFYEEGSVASGLDMLASILTYAAAPVVPSVAMDK